VREVDSIQGPSLLLNVSPRWAAAVGGEKVTCVFAGQEANESNPWFPQTRQWSADTDERRLQLPQTVASAYFSALFFSSLIFSMLVRR
jgi:hypothetical protein